MKKVKVLTMLGFSLLIVAALMGLGGKAKLKGKLLTDAVLTQMEGNKSLCVPDSGEGLVLSIVQDHENPLFPSTVTNQVHLFIWFSTPPATGSRIHLPTEGVQVCYYEKGDLLMFKTFEPQGWIQFDNIPPSKTITGSLDLKLVKPHHNMSNSDYHYMGGDFKLKLVTGC